MNWERIHIILYNSIAISFSLFQLYIGTTGLIDPFILRITHLYFVLILTFLALPKKSGRLFVESTINYVFLILIIFTGTYLIFMWSNLTERFPLVSPLPQGGLILGIIFFVVLIEAVRRHMGKEMVIVVIVITAYVLFGKYMFGIFKHLGYSLAKVIDIAYLSTEGTFGETLGISASYLYLYILFGTFLLRSGLGELLIEVGKALVGHVIGGPGKIAVVSCATFGMVSASAIANVVTIGNFTIPLMKNFGYPPYLAGAIIAIAASGDIIMPPVMGAIAFLMSNYLAMPYGKIIIYAFLPAILYYLGIYFAVHFDAKKRCLPVIPKEELPHLFPILKRGWYFSIPIILLIVLLIKQYSVALAVLIPLYTLMAIMVVLPNKGLKSKLFDIGIALRDGAKNALLVAIALAVGNLIEGLISITGVALKLSIVLVHISPNIYVLLALAGATLFLLGLALPSFVIYITAVPILVPAMVKFGIDQVAAHLFLVYWAVLSMITPPTGGSFFAAAGVAGAPVMKVGWTATRIAAPIYLLTFIFTLHPALLLRGGNFWETIYYFLPAAFGVIAISSANAGYLLSDLNFFQRVMLVVGGIFLIYGHYVTLLLGIFVLGVVLYTQHRTEKISRGWQA